MTQTKRENEHLWGAATLVREKARLRIERLNEGRNRLPDTDPRYPLLLNELEEAERAERLASAALADLRQDVDAPGQAQ
jgi:hypothetical protein